MFLPFLLPARMPEGWPPGAWAKCKDGSYWMHPERSGACSGRKGVERYRDGSKAKR